LQKRLDKNPEVERQSPNMKYLLELALVFQDMREIVESTLERGEKELPSRYMNGFKEEQVKQWERRLKWADKVDKGGGKA
jgi:hypothetical protein